MKAITIKQPFASLIAAGLKEYEFRTWKTKYRGEILIHAGKGVDKKAMKKFERITVRRFGRRKDTNLLRPICAIFHICRNLPVNMGDHIFRISLIQCVEAWHQLLWQAGETDP